ncbi:family 43 glycosylhydrolase [Hymenobacter cellulosilyticus]|uniref:Family 43 glycosylhydrolase n=1 Tax=Hymenobacter cellulosilyticus TaxID=2932248 RepID=A0A8T9Q660_9BACT|nr:family 43 glycosylhydrolase [Hymenobacter cellulosilyticus]UOQ73126.1 family 43 glycosylhydrolase [Hymenobacter cellulosilyticus]
MSFDFESAPSFDLVPTVDSSTDYAAVDAPLVDSTPTVAPPVEAKPTNYANIVLPGDFPDPTIAKIGNTYWASATSAEWGPVFPMFKSDNLVDWELVTHVFPGQLPDWCDANFWAPEIFYEGGKTFIYYTARKKNGPLCVAVASADQPEGPYTDHGPLVGQRLGSIDGFPVRDEHGDLYLVWKEDGNSKKKPTPIWAQRINEKRMGLVGKKVELFRNTEKWEGCLVEGSAIVRHDEYFYMFYAGNGCCGKCCNYATGVARAKSLLGPWEKCPQNPILDKNKTWKCPGHGTVAEYEGRWFLLHHAYYTDSHEFVGRQGILSEFTWNAEGWPEFDGRSPQAAPLPDLSVLNVTDNFTSNQLAQTWQWPVGEQPEAGVSDGQLLLTASPVGLGAMVAQRTFAATYKAVTTLDFANLAPGTFAGIGAIGDHANTLSLMAGDQSLQLWHVKGGKQECLTKIAVESCKNLSLRLEVWGGQRYRFSYSADGLTWIAMPTESFAINGTYLPPWDRGIRIALLAQGPATSTVAFNHFSLRNKR